MSFKQYITESSLSRIWKQTKEHDSGTISAFRSAKDCNEGEPYTKKENLQRSAKLKAKLLSLGYGVTKIQGTYIENYGSNDEREVKEESFIVVDLKDTGHLERDLRILGEEFEQDSITYQEKDGDYYLIGTNRCPNGYPGYGKKIKLGKPIYGKSGEFHSKIRGRPFVFESIESNLKELTDFYPTEIRSIKLLAES
jgi:hypothetical protein